MRKPRAPGRPALYPEDRLRRVSRLEAQHRKLAAPVTLLAHSLPVALRTSASSSASSLSPASGVGSSPPENSRQQSAIVCIMTDFLGWDLEWRSRRSMSEDGPCLQPSLEPKENRCFRRQFVLAAASTAASRGSFCAGRILLSI